MFYDRNVNTRFPVDVYYTTANKIRISHRNEVQWSHDKSYARTKNTNDTGDA